MTAREQQVRLHFLIVLTIVVALFGVTRYLRTYHESRRREAYQQTELQLREYMTGILRAPEQELEDLARAEHGRMRRDAAALLMQARGLLEDRAATRPGPRHAEAVAALEQIKANFGRLRNGDRAVFPQEQPFIRGYYAAVDGSFQPYVVCVPAERVQPQRLPLVVTLGGTPSDGQPKGLEGKCYQGAVSVWPVGRDGFELSGASEDDVLSVVEDVRALYRIDDTRIYLVGRGAGALLAYHMGVHYPHVFRGIVALGPHRGASEALSRAAFPAEVNDLAAACDFVGAAAWPGAYAENLGRSAVVAAEAGSSALATNTATAAMAGRVRQLGYLLEYLPFPQLPGGQMPEWVEQYAAAKMLGAARTESPRQFRFITSHLRHDRAWWLKVDLLGDPTRLATVDAACTNGAVDLTTDNVGGLTLMLTSLPEPARVIRADGTEFTLPRDYAGSRFSLERDAGQWRIPRDGALRKRRGLSGPLNDVLRDPFMLVYGTSADTDMTRTFCKREADRFAAEWEARFGDMPRCKSDTEVDQDDIAQYNLVLFGGADANGVTRRIAAQLPVRIADGNVRLGDEVLNGQGMGLLLSYPNPLAPGRMVTVVAGAAGDGLFQAYARAGSPFASHQPASGWSFDFAVFDGRTAGPETLLAAGFFGNGWQLPREDGSPMTGGRLWRRGPQAAAGLKRQGTPPLLRAADSEERGVPLSTVVPLAVQQDGAVGFDRTADGRAIRVSGTDVESGLGVVATSSVSFELGGRFRRFESGVALADLAESGRGPAESSSARVVFEVLGDGVLLASAGPLSRREGTPVRGDVRVDVTKVRVLTLRVEPADYAGVSCGACVWIEPTLSR